MEFRRPRGRTGGSMYGAPPAEGMYNSGAGASAALGQAVGELPLGEPALGEPPLGERALREPPLGERALGEAAGGDVGGGEKAEEEEEEEEECRSLYLPPRSLLLLHAEAR